MKTVLEGPVPTSKKYPEAMTMSPKQVNALAYVLYIKKFQAKYPRRYEGLKPSCYKKEDDRMQK